MIGRHPTRKAPTDPTYSAQWSGVSYAPHAKGQYCAKDGTLLHREGESLYCPNCDDYVTSTTVINRVSGIPKGSAGSLVSSYQIAPAYVLRFIPHALSGELVNLYHLARTALSGSVSDRYHRMLWASQEFSKAHPTYSSGAAYKDLDGLLS